MQSFAMTTDQARLIIKKYRDKSMRVLNSAPVLIKDITPGREGSFIRELTEFQGHVWFSGMDGDDWELWRSDGTEEGTFKLDIATDIPSSSQPKHLTAVDDQLFFEAWTNNWRQGLELVVSDGTLAGTNIVEDINAGSFSSSIRDLTQYGQDLYFSAVDYGFINEEGRHLWWSDGQSTRKISDAYVLPSAIERKMITFNEELYFVAETLDDGTALWKFNGNTIDFVFDARPESIENSNIKDLTVSGGRLFFTAEAEATGRELYSTDGTVTALVKDIQTNSSLALSNSNPRDLVDIDGTLFFAAQTTEHGRELWSSDGTEDGTQLIADIRPDSRSNVWGPKYLTNANGRLFFSSTSKNNDGDKIGNELWLHNPQTGETRLVKDINSRRLQSSIDENFNEPFIAIGDLILFAADNGTHGNELWVSDGTTEGTHMVADLNPGKSGSDPEDLTLINQTVYFSAETAELGRELYRLDVPESIENQHGDTGADSNNDGFVDKSESYTIKTKTEPLTLRNQSGRTFSSQSSKQWEAKKVVASDNGYDILIQGLRRKTGYFKLWRTNEEGIINKRSSWKSTTQALQKGWETLFGDLIQNDQIIGIPVSDIDQDGLVDEPHDLAIYSKGEAISIQSASGRMHSKAVTRTWNADQAVATKRGFSLLLRGANQRADHFRRWTLDHNGQIRGKSRWLTGHEARGKGWEKQFGEVFGDGELLTTPVSDASVDGLAAELQQLSLVSDSQLPGLQ